ncbi:MAG: hypothetical protein H7321_05930 [Bacteroidia bacterium]|nr:hypothetical protein [Bacteroidia bacterium]
MISTKVFSVSKREYLNLFIKDYFRKKWWMFTFVIIAMITVYTSYSQSNSTIVIAVGFFYPLLVIASLWYNIYYTQNELLFAERKHVFYNDKFTSSTGNVSKSEYTYMHLKKIALKKEYALLYLNKNAFVYVPYYAFENENDRQKFISIASHANTHILGNFKNQTDTIIDQ